MDMVDMPSGRYIYGLYLGEVYGLWFLVLWILPSGYLTQPSKRWQMNMDDKHDDSLCYTMKIHGYVKQLEGRWEGSQLYICSCSYLVMQMIDYDGSYIFPCFCQLYPLVN